MATTIEGRSAVTLATHDMSLLSAHSHPLALPRSSGIGARSCPVLAAGGRLPHRSGDQSVSNGLLTRELALSADGFSFLSRRPVRGLLIEAPSAHLPEYTFALHLPLQDATRLLDVIVSNEYLHACCSQESSAQAVKANGIGRITRPGAEVHSRHQPGGDEEDPGGNPESPQGPSFHEERKPSLTPWRPKPIQSIHKMQLARQNSQLFYKACLNLATRGGAAALAFAPAFFVSRVSRHRACRWRLLTRPARRLKSGLSAQSLLRVPEYVAQHC